MVHQVSATHKNLAEELLSRNPDLVKCHMGSWFQEKSELKIWIIHNPSNTLEVPAWLHQRYLGTRVPLGISPTAWSFQQMEEHCIKDILSTETSKKIYTECRRGPIVLYMDFAEAEFTLRLKCTEICEMIIVEIYVNEKERFRTINNEAKALLFYHLEWRYHAFLMDFRRVYVIPSKI